MHKEIMQEAHIVMQINGISYYDALIKLCRQYESLEKTLACYDLIREKEYYINNRAELLRTDGYVYITIDNQVQTNILFDNAEISTVIIRSDREELRRLHVAPGQSKISFYLKADTACEISLYDKNGFVQKFYVYSPAKEIKEIVWQNNIKRRRHFFNARNYGYAGQAYHNIHEKARDVALIKKELYDYNFILETPKVLPGEGKIQINFDMIQKATQYAYLVFKEIDEEFDSFKASRVFVQGRSYRIDPFIDIIAKNKQYLIWLEDDNRSIFSYPVFYSSNAEDFLFADEIQKAENDNIKKELISISRKCNLGSAFDKVFQSLSSDKDIYLDNIHTKIIFELRKNEYLYCARKLIDITLKHKARKIMSNPEFFNYALTIDTKNRGVFLGPVSSRKQDAILVIYRYNANSIAPTVEYRSLKQSRSYIDMSTHSHVLLSAFDLMERQRAGFIFMNNSMHNPFTLFNNIEVKFI